VLAAPACYFAICTAGKKLASQLLELLVSREKEKRQSFVLTIYEREFNGSSKAERCSDTR